MAERLNNVPIFPASAPIYKLSVDVFWNIFRMNTDIFARRDRSNSRTHPIDVLRQTSQVCRFWRIMVLDSPALWGQVIDLDRLQTLGNRWAQEIVARAANGPQLCIKGTRGWEKEADLRVLFVKILNQHWPKIQKLEISITKPLESKSNTTPWEPLRRPAPLLEIFDVSFNYSDSKNLNKEGPPLFADHAPVLRMFKLSATPNSRITLQAPWLGHLTTLTLPVSFPATDILNVLADMPLIETLKVKTILEGESRESVGLEQRGTVSLPCLKQLTITGTFTASFLLVKFIIPAPICSLRLDVRDKNHRGIRSKTIRDIGKFLISRYIQNHFARCQAPLVIENLAITEKRINITLDPPKSARSCLNLTIRSDSDVSRHMSYHLLTPLLESCQFTHIDQFYFVHEHCLNNSIEKGVSAALKVILSTIPRILDMDASQDALELISLLSLDKQLTQIYRLSIDEDTMALDFEEVILCFLFRQLLDKKPVRTLMLNYLDLDWSFLEDVTGLEVSWPGGEYVCGSGTPKKLEFGSLRYQF